MCLTEIEYIIILEEILPTQILYLEKLFVNVYSNLNTVQADKAVGILAEICYKSLFK